MSLLVVGSIAYDSIETPFGVEDDILGGSASYFSVAASHFTDVKIVAAVGEDFSHESVYKEHNIDIQGLERLPGKTFRWKGEYRGDMNEAITHRTELNVFENFSPHIPETYLECKYIFLANIDPVLQYKTLKNFENPKALACDTMNFWIDGSREALDKVISEVGILIINEQEARSLAGVQNILEAARAIQARGPQTVIIKRGEYGALAYSSDDLFALPGLPLDSVKDPTGAGDSFAGGFMGYLAGTGSAPESASLRSAVVYGSVMASFAVEAFGLGRLREVRKQEIETRFEAFRKLTQFEI
ncbi:PfkB family carbohydrate kinase [Acidobacteriota bacterium]